MKTFTRDIHLVVTHMKPSTFDGKHVFGQMYPMCQYDSPTWFSHREGRVETPVTDNIELASCSLCLVVHKREHGAQ